jgi:hypothetical protein
MNDETRLEIYVIHEIAYFEAFGSIEATVFRIDAPKNGWSKTDPGNLFENSTRSFRIDLRPTRALITEAERCLAVDESTAYMPTILAEFAKIVERVHNDWVDRERPCDADEELNKLVGSSFQVNF